uniref:KRAB domain-containing protein n=1 Tax=Leptobrachium leishanense TaxID=445787 RepID=A0A8C5MMV0_9ANUR
LDINSHTVQITFDDIAVYFSKEEWNCLGEAEQDLYKDVIMDNYQTLLSLGKTILHYC